MHPIARPLVACVVLVALAACSGSSDAGPTTGPATTTPSTSVPARTTTTTPRPPGPTADLSTQLSGGDGPYIATATPDDLAGAGYVQHEFVTAGTATSYAADGALTKDGRWTFVPGPSAGYRTRILVRTPKEASSFSGTVVLEWLNVSGGVDAEPEWSNLQEEITRAGDAWVGVSAQGIGIEGGPVAVKVEGVPGSDLAGKGLKAIDPARYGTLEHPGDGFSFDIFTQVARAIRAGTAMAGLRPQRLIAAGQSQSAFAMVTYVNGVQPLTKAFDGFFVHSRGAAGLPLVDPGAFADIAGALSGPPTTFRTDLATPVFDIQTETDVASVLNSYAARQPDSDRFRLWEVAGTAHADVHTVGSSATYIDCGVPINDGPLHIVAKAAYRALTAWLTDGTEPKIAPRLAVTAGGAPQIQRDADAIAVGGIRTPPVEVPVATLSGAPGPTASTICLLLGSTTPFTTTRLAERYPSPADYQRRYAAATDATIAAGFALPEDRAALLAFADPSRLAG